MDPIEYNRNSGVNKFGARASYAPIPLTEQNTSYHGARPYDGQEHLLSDSQAIGHSRSISAERSVSPPGNRAPRLPSVDMYGPQHSGYAPAPTGPLQSQGYRGQAL